MRDMRAGIRESSCHLGSRHHIAGLEPPTQGIGRGIYQSSWQTGAGSFQSRLLWAPVQLVAVRFVAPALDCCCLRRNSSLCNSQNRAIASSRKPLTSRFLRQPFLGFRYILLQRLPIFRIDIFLRVGFRSGLSAVVASFLLLLVLGSDTVESALQHWWWW
ncbi:hypothetical protein FN846DRAFT_942715 [Sphaerosporella brunnea]|uniref:Uncharacterized protein n=1 Tax=Sphaerosporella brunnea TaxID=1250544 RepID=A0A5J5F181_9PEZI|nr:hypothetical protein FN846DRAFT_942715 [Sphaerosporella brunnea]